MTTKVSPKETHSSTTGAARWWMSDDLFRRSFGGSCTESSHGHAFNEPRTITVFISHEVGDDRPLRWVTEALEPFGRLWEIPALAFAAHGLPQWKLVGISPTTGLLVDAGRVTRRPEPEIHPQRPDRQAAALPHARLAREVRERTGLPAAQLGSALGVTREQYQRWLRGDPISTIRHGLLVYLHAVVADAFRRLGPEAHVWWRTPRADGRTPAQLLADRLVDQVHRLVSELPDAAPIVDDVLVGMPAQQPRPLDDEAAVDGDDEESWSPYGARDRPDA